MTDLVIQRRVASKGVPAPASLRRFAEAALGRNQGELTLRIVGKTESRALNRRYRGRDKATNVLSFSYGEISPRLRPPVVLGDLVICAPVLAQEARAQGKAPMAHWAHLVVHGCLHLLGYDHEKKSAALLMEEKERKVLRRLGFPDPYG